MSSKNELTAQKEIKTNGTKKSKSAKASGRKLPKIDWAPFLRVGSLVIMVSVALFALVFFIMAMVAPNTLLDWMLNRHIGLYSNALSSVTANLVGAILSRPFQAVYTSGYIRTMGFLVLLLSIPVVYAMLNIYYLSCNAGSNRPFKKSTCDYIKATAYSFGTEFLLSTVLFIILRIINKSIPYYTCYAVASIAVLSAIIFVSMRVFLAMIDKMKELSAQTRKSSNDGNS